MTEENYLFKSVAKLLFFRNIVVQNWHLPATFALLTQKKDDKQLGKSSSMGNEIDPHPLHISRSTDPVLI